MIEDVLFADVILPLPFDFRFTYRVPAAFQVNIKTGIRVIVQFGKRKYYSALVYKLHQIRPEGDFEIKDIDAILVRLRQAKETTTKTNANANVTNNLSVPGPSPPSTFWSQSDG